MIVCSCRGVSCRRIRQEARDGASTAKEVGLRCGAGRVCGACTHQIKSLIHEERAAAAASEDAVSAVVLIGGSPAAA